MSLGNTGFVGFASPAVRFCYGFDPVLSGSVSYGASGCSMQASMALTLSPPLQACIVICSFFDSCDMSRRATEGERERFQERLRQEGGAQDEEHGACGSILGQGTLLMELNLQVYSSLAVWCTEGATQRHFKTDGQK